jgi:hypothetical protein
VIFRQPLRSEKFNVNFDRNCYHFKFATYSLRFLQRRRIFIDSVRTSQETHYVSLAKTSRLALFGETVAEDHAEHTNTLLRQNAELLSILKLGGVF